MADHLFYTLLNRVQTLLVADSSVSADNVGISRSRKVPHTALPFYAIYLGPDQPVGEFGANNLSTFDHNLMINIEILVDATEQGLIEKHLLDARKILWSVLMADFTQGLNFVLQTIPNGAGDPELSSEAEYRTASQKTEWIFQVRTSVQDVTTI